MNNLFAISANNERVNIYILSKILGKPVISFNDVRLTYLFKDMEKPFIFTALYQERGGLYNYRKVHPIDEIALDATTRHSIYQRSQIFKVDII